jgi:hypothetical protein
MSHITFADNASVNYDVEFQASVPVVLSAYTHNSINVVFMASDFTVKGERLLIANHLYPNQETINSKPPVPKVRDY